MSQAPFYQAKPTLKIAEGIYKTKIAGLFYLKYRKFKDERGFFAQVLEPERVRASINPDFQIKQSNLSVSQSKVIRGLHAEGWNKLITVLSGHAQCVIADVRSDSANYLAKEYFDFDVKADDAWGEALYISARLANSICAIEGPVYYLYGVDQLYQERNLSDDQAISIFDPDLNISWPFAKEELIISQRDLNSVSLKQLKQGN